MKLNRSIAIRRKKGEIVLESKKRHELLNDQVEKFEIISKNAGKAIRNLRRGSNSLHKSSSIESLKMSIQFSRF